MEKLLMCRVCLAENVRMYVVVNTILLELYEKLTGNPFVTEDRRPILICFFCCTKLKQCGQFQRKCLEAEELFAQMLNEDYEPNPLKNQEHSVSCNGLIQAPVEVISIVDVYQTESVAVKEELPDVCEILDDVIEPKEEHQSDELELENQDNRFSDAEGIPAQQHSESDSEDNLMEFKIKVEQHEVLRNKRRASETQCAPVAKKPKRDTRRPKPRDATNTPEQKKNEHNQKLSIVSKKIKKSQIREKPFKCDICQRGFNRKTHVISHIRTHTGEKPFKCYICQRGFNRKTHVISHIRTHTGKKTFKCDICQRGFNNKNSLVKHTLTHTDEKPFKCDICQRGFKRKTHVISHIRIHTGEKPFKCDTCQRSFSHKTSLVSHTRTHTGEKRFKCDTCQRSFIHKKSLVSHTRTHTGEKPFNCNICQRSFSKKDYLVTHTLTHTGEKRFKCDICQRGFNYKTHLIHHIRTHTGEKPFKCDVCQRSFSQKISLVKHNCTQCRF